MHKSDFLKRTNTGVWDLKQTNNITNSLFDLEELAIPHPALKDQNHFNTIIQFLVLSIELAIPRSALKVHEHLTAIIKCSIPRFCN